MADDRRTGIDGDQITDGTITPDEFDSTNSPSDDYILTYDSVAGKMKWDRNVAKEIPRRIGWKLSPTHNGEIEVLGWYIKTDTAQSLANATPITSSEPGYHSHFVIDVSSASGVPFDVTVTGVSIDEGSGVETVSDTETISVTGNGYYQTSKSWTDAVIFSVESGKSCTIDIYRTTYWDLGNSDFTVVGSRLEFEPDAVSWSIKFVICKVNDDGSLFFIDNTTLSSTDTHPRADSGKPGKYKRAYNYFINGANGEGLILFVDQQSIRYFYMEVKYSV